MTCAVCGSIPDVARADTGREQYFPAPVRSLTRHELGREDDLWECPECEALFLWHDASSWTGSGNDDEEVLTRLPASQARIVHAFIHPGVPPATGLAGLPGITRTLVLSHLLRHDRARAERLVPWMTEVARRGTPWARQFLAGLGHHVEVEAATPPVAAPTPPPPTSPSPAADPARDEPWTRMERPLWFGISLENAHAFVLEVGARLDIATEDIEVTVTREVEEDLVSMEPAEVSTSLGGRLGAVRLHAFAGREPFRHLEMSGPSAEVARVDRAISAIFAERFTPRLRTRRDLLLPDDWEKRARYRSEGEVPLDGTTWVLQPEGEAWFAIDVSASGIHRTPVGPVPRVVEATTITRRRNAGGSREPCGAEAVASALLGESLGPPEAEASIEHGGDEVGRKRRFRVGEWIVLDGRARWSAFLPEVSTVQVHHERGDPWCLLAEVVADDDADEATIRVLGSAAVREDVARRLVAALDAAGWSSPTGAG